MKSLTKFLLAVVLASLIGHTQDAQSQEAKWRPLPLKRRITHVQPMTGIVLWTTSKHNASDAIQLEYTYLGYNDVVSSQGIYDWSKVDTCLQAVAKRKHQAILRFYDTYPDKTTTIPNYIKQLQDYKETHGKSEGKNTSFPDWSQEELKRFILEFYQKFAARYDTDSRLAFLQVGFGLWAEYHIYDGPFVLGKTFPAKDYQEQFARHLDKTFQNTPWMISIDAADNKIAPYTEREGLLTLGFGLFDDSFLSKEHPKVNALNWKAIGHDRWKTAPAGGEFSYYTSRDQQLALASKGPHGVSFEQSARQFHISFMIGNDQPQYQNKARIQQAGMETGYRLRVTKWETNGAKARVTVMNKGIAPLYHHAFFAADGLRARESLRGILPGESRTFTLATTRKAPKLTIESDRLVLGQSIEFEANLP